jgi:hypothetical protein
MIKSHVLYRLSYGLSQRPTRLASAQRARAPCVGGARGRVKNCVGGLRLFKRLWTTYVVGLLSRRTCERQRRRSLYAIVYHPAFDKLANDPGLSKPDHRCR